MGPRAHTPPSPPILPPLLPPPAGRTLHVLVLRPWGAWTPHTQTSCRRPPRPLAPAASPPAVAPTPPAAVAVAVAVTAAAPPPPSGTPSPHVATGWPPPPPRQRRLAPRRAGQPRLTPQRRGCWRACHGRRPLRGARGRTKGGLGDGWTAGQRATRRSRRWGQRGRMAFTTLPPPPSRSAPLQVPFFPHWHLHATAGNPPSVPTLHVLLAPRAQLASAAGRVAPGLPRLATPAAAAVQVVGATGDAACPSSSPRLRARCVRHSSSPGSVWVLTPPPPANAVWPGQPEARP